MKYQGSATGGFAGMSSYTLESADGASAMVEVSVPPAFVLWGWKDRYFRWGPAVAQITVNHVNNCQTFAAAVTGVEDAEDGPSGFVFTNSYYSAAMRRVTFGVTSFPFAKPNAPADHCYVSALANVFRFSEDSRVTQTVPPPTPQYPGGGWL